MKSMGSRVALSWVLVVGFAALSHAVDSDGDGLSDFDETHKYLTDPKKADSDGDTVPDGDWHERREYSYSVRSVVKVLRPCNLAVVNDSYQDARVLKETDTYVELEVVHYPLNTVAQSIRGTREWTNPPEDLRECLQPGVTTNWDEELKKDLTKALRRDGIDVSSMSDAEVVRRVSKWLLDRADYRYMFSTYFLRFPNGKAEIMPGLEDAFKGERGNTDLPFEKLLQHEVYGKGMFYNKSRGTCTSTAIYLTTGLRAVGIPCRMVLLIPVVDSNDEHQMALIERGTSNHRLRKSVVDRLRGQTGFAAHTINEVFVGGRWHRLDSSHLGVDIDEVFGLATHVHTFLDLSEAGLTETWGRRYGTGARDNVFKTSNPYCTTELSDRYGIYCSLPNPEIQVKEHREITISKAYWHDSDDAPDSVRNSPSTSSPGGGRLFIHGEEWFTGESYTQYGHFRNKADPHFRLVADGHPEIAVRLSGLYITDTSQDIRDFEIHVPAKEFQAMARGVAYRLVPVNATKTHRWKVKDQVRVTKP